MNPPPPMAMNRSGPEGSTLHLYRVAGCKEADAGLTELVLDLDGSRLDSLVHVVVAQPDPVFGESTLNSSQARPEKERTWGRRLGCPFRTSDRI